MDERSLLRAIALCAAMAVFGAILAVGCLPSMALRKPGGKRLVETIPTKMGKTTPGLE